MDRLPTLPRLREALSIRSATLEDAPELGKFIHNVWKDLHRPSRGLVDEVAARRRLVEWSNILRLPEEQEIGCWVANHEDYGAIGLAACGASRDPDREPGLGEYYAFFAQMDVAKAGLADQFLHQVIKFLKDDLSCFAATAWVDGSNDWARSWLEEHGWKTDESTRGHYVGNLELVEVRYQLKLK